MRVHSNENHSVWWQVECAWAVTHREMLYAIGWTVWGIRDRGWSDGMSWPMNSLRAPARTEDLIGDASDNLMLHGVKDEHSVCIWAPFFETAHYRLYALIIFLVNAWLIFMTGANTVLLEHPLLVTRRVWGMDCQSDAFWFHVTCWTFPVSLSLSLLHVLYTFL